MDKWLQQQIDILGVKPDATLDAIRKAYRSRAAELHPDRNQEDTTAEFQNLQQAYQAVMKYHNQCQKIAELRSASPSNEDRLQAALNRHRLRESYGRSEAKPERSRQQNAPSTAKVKRSDKYRLRQIRCKRCRRQHWFNRAYHLTRGLGCFLRWQETSIRAVLCPGCARKLVFINNLYTLLLGWWAILGGPARTLKCYRHNCTQAKPVKTTSLAVIYRQANALLRGGWISEAYLCLQDYQLYSEDLEKKKRLNITLKRIKALPGYTSLASQKKWLQTRFLYAAQLPLLLLIFITAGLGSLPLWIDRFYQPVQQQLVPAQLESPDEHRVTYPNDRLGSHYTLVNTPLYQTADTRFEPGQVLPPYTPVEVTEVLPNGMLKLSYEQSNWITAEHFIGYGEGPVAAKLGCDQYPRPRPQSGEILSGNLGSVAMKVSHRGSLDGLLTFADQRQKPLQQIYLRAGDKINLYELPEGVRHVQIQYGRFYNHDCGHFTADHKRQKIKLSLLGTQQELKIP